MKHRIALVALLLIVLGAAVWLELDWPREPVYQGKPLTYWLRILTLPAANISSGYGLWRPDPQAVEAIRHIGTNAIPTLLHMTRAHDSALKRKLIALAQKQHLIRIRFTAAGERHLQARVAFRELGSTASNAVPALIEIYEANYSVSSQEAAAYVLGSIGLAARQAVPSLVRILADTNNYARRASIVALGQIHAEPELAVPALIKSLSDPYPGVRQLATEALGRFGADARPAVPTLVEIYDQSTDESFHAATALGLIGPAAKSAVPSLLRGLANTNLDYELRRLTILSLGRIHAEPDLVVPALKKSLSASLDDTDVRLRYFSIMALGQYGSDAKPVVPLLTNLLRDPNPNVRQEVVNTLKLIDADAAAQSE